MSKELIWFLAPISSILWMAGGTWKKAIRRIGVPAAIVFSTVLYFGLSWWQLPLALSLFGVTTLPFTLKGDSIHDYWFNWVWIWIAGFIFGLPVVFTSLICSAFSLQVLLLCLIPMFVQGIFGTLSNIKETSKWFPWKLCECMIGLSVAIPHCFIMNYS